MKITEVLLKVLEDPDSTSSVQKLVQVPNLLRIQYTHSHMRVPDRKARQSFIEVRTDEGIRGRCTTTMTPHEAEVLRHNVVGENPLHRERLYQMLHKGTRWVYLRPGWFADFDNCLWDIAGKVAGLPVCALVGKVRERVPAYLMGGNTDIAGYLKDIETGKRFGVNAYKFHSYKGGKADVPILTAVREAVGPDYTLIHDPVCSYSLREAIEIGHLLEELGFVWLEEPMHEQKMHQFQKLCSELSIPVMANEMLMADIGISTQWLMHGATDLLRANAMDAGTTGVLKMAHFAELYDTTVELAGIGGLFGLLHATLACCIDNSSFYEYYYDEGDGLRQDGRRWGMTNAPLVEDGHLAPSDGPGWGAEWDEDLFEARTVEVH